MSTATATTMATTTAIITSSAQDAEMMGDRKMSVCAGGIEYPRRAGGPC